MTGFFKQTLYISLVMEISEANLGFISICASEALENDEEQEYLKQLYDQLSSLELSVVTRERLGDKISDQILAMFNE